MTRPDQARKNAKRQRREAVIAAKRETAQRREADRRRRDLLTYGGVAAALILVVGLAVGAYVRGRPGLAEVTGAPVIAGSAPAAATGVAPAAAPARGVVERYADQGGTHIRLGMSHPPYNSNPPTSGWHTPETAAWGVHRQQIPDQTIVHNLEHGGIWISYRDTEDAALVEQLKGLVSRYRSKVILTPRPQNDAPIAVAAWTRVMKLDEYDEDRIVRFINAFRNKGPEQVPD
jgi:hypothetical protein